MKILGWLISWSCRSGRGYVNFAFHAFHPTRRQVGWLVGKPMLGGKPIVLGSGYSVVQSTHTIALGMVCCNHSAFNILDAMCDVIDLHKASGSIGFILSRCLGTLSHFLREL